MYLVAANLKNGRHFEFWNFFRWLTGFVKRAISKEYVCQFWCLFPEMKDSFTYLPHYWKKAGPRVGDGWKHSHDVVQQKRQRSMTKMFLVILLIVPLSAI